MPEPILRACRPDNMATQSDAPAPAPVSKFNPANLLSLITTIMPLIQAIIAALHPTPAPTPAGAAEGKHPKPQPPHIDPALIAEAKALVAKTEADAHAALKLHHDPAATPEQIAAADKALQDDHAAMVALLAKLRPAS